jgi:hypothetical protein
VAIVIGEKTVYKILRVSFYWPSIFSDIFTKFRACIECHIFIGKGKFFSLPLKPIYVNEPFQ